MKYTLTSKDGKSEFETDDPKLANDYVFGYGYSVTEKSNSKGDRKSATPPQTARPPFNDSEGATK